MVVALRYMDKNASSILLCSQPFTKKELMKAKDNLGIFLIIHENNQGDNIGSWSFASAKEALISYRQIVAKASGTTLTNDFQLLKVTREQSLERDQRILEKWRKRKNKG